MRLTQLLLTRSRRRPGAARGNKKAGKHQEPHVFSEKERKAFVNNLLTECTNEMWLTRPYLNKQQERCLTVNFEQATKGSPVVNVDSKSEYEYYNRKYRINMHQHVSFQERWSYASTGKKWKLEDRELHKKMELERFARAVIPKNYPDFYPPAVEKWEEWNKIEGFGLKNSKKTLLPVVKNNKDTDAD